MNFDPSLLTKTATPLSAYAAAKGNLEMVELLLRNDADPTQVTREGDTPVELALRFGHGGIADVLKRAGSRSKPARAATPPRLAVAIILYGYAGQRDEQEISRDTLLEKYAKEAGGLGR